MEKWLRVSPIVLFCAFFIKLGTLGAGYPDVLALFVVSGLIIGMQIVFKSKEIEALDLKVTDLEAQLNASKKDIESIRAFMNSQKMNSMRVTQNVR